MSNRLKIPARLVREHLERYPDAKYLALEAVFEDCVRMELEDETGRFLCVAGTTEQMHSSKTWDGRPR